MTENIKVPHGTPEWFAMVGAILTEAATQAELAPDYNLRLVERYTDGIELSPGVVQGLCFEIVAGRPAFMLGARHGQRGDITVEVTKAASYTLNTLRSDDPRFPAAFANLQASGELKVEGDLARPGSWFSAVHDRIVDQTA